MARKEVTKYHARWNYDNHQGIIGIKDIDNKWHWPRFSDPNEFAVVVDLLRNEKRSEWLISPFGGCFVTSQKVEAGCT